VDRQNPSLGGLAPRRVPEAYVRAEVASMPLASEEAFHEAITELRPSLEETSRGGRKTKNLWRQCERLLSEHASGWSLDRLIAIRDFFWFNREPQLYVRDQPGTSLHHYLRRLATLHVSSRPGVTEIARAGNFFDATTHYRWLTFAMPEDLLLMSMGLEPPATRVDLDPPLVIRRLLDNGVAEIHQHVGASMDFSILWMSTLAALANPNLEPNAIRDPGLPFGQSETLFRWLLAAAIARCLVVEYLLRENADGPLIDLVLDLRSRSEWSFHRWRALERSLFALEEGDESLLPDFYALRNLYQDVHPQGHRLWREPPTTLAKAWRLCDPIAVRLSLSSPNEGEQWLMQRGLALLERSEFRQKRDETFERLFWQMVRLRCILYRAVVQRPMTAGLQWFIRFNGRLDPLRTPLAEVRTEVSYEVAGGARDRSIAALEVRCTAKDNPSDLAEELRRLTNSWKRVLNEVASPDSQRPEFGVVLHLVKERDPEHRWEGGSPPAHGIGTHAEPAPGLSFAIRPGGRYADYFASQARKAKAAAELMRRMPSILWVLRGIDVTADELSVPTWVLVPLYRFLERESAIAAAQCPGRIKPQPLGLTAHVGEDFRHLMEGMRRIFECVHYLLRRSGGRLGHATALGYDPRLWAELTGSVMMPVEDRMWDLVFEWRLYTGFKVPDELRVSAPPGRIGWLENEIRQLSTDVFAWSWEPHELALDHHMLHVLWSGPEVDEKQTEVGLDVFDKKLGALAPEFVQNNWHASLRLEDYRMNESVFRRGQRLIDVLLDEPEVVALQAVQDGLRRLVSVRGIVVEVNPTSNLLIGNLLDLRNHPTLRLFPPEPQEGAPPPVRIALGSDDPITFSTHLLREYSLLYHAALSAGYPERSVISWLQDVQRTSMDARFTLPWRPSARAMVRRLLRRLDCYLQTPFRCRASLGRRRASSRLKRHS
jgi:hypothetical protein